MPKMERHDLVGCDDDIAMLYLKTAAQQIKKMTAGMQSKCMADVQRFAHKLSGSSSFLELKDIAKLLNELEKAAAQNFSFRAGSSMTTNR